jgi:hypothetical protein
MAGIIYKLTGQRSRGVIASYHQKPSALHVGKTPHRVDIAGLKKAQQRDLITFDGIEYTSRFTIGFEIEKNDLHRGAVREYELLCGFERDGSCGYEAVTHILPLLPATSWRTKVFDMMHKAEKIIDDRFSVSDKRCGGHITLSVQGMSGDELRAKVRKNCGVILALFRKRLNNKYCGANRRMQEGIASVFNSYGQTYDYGRHDNHWKYQLALVKNGSAGYDANGKLLEFRLPSRVQSVKQLMRRYELFYELVNFSVNNPNGSHEAFLKRVRPIILSMYNGDENLTSEVLRLSKHFREFILSGRIHQDIAQYLQ